MAASFATVIRIQLLLPFACLDLMFSNAGICFGAEGDPRVGDMIKSECHGIYQGSLKLIKRNIAPSGRSHLAEAEGSACNSAS